VRALICGAGIAGLTLARMLDAMDWQVVLVERAAGLREEGYLIDFFGPGFDVAESIGLLPRLREKAYTVTEVNYVDQLGRPRAALKTSRQPPHGSCPPPQIQLLLRRLALRAMRLPGLDRMLNPLVAGTGGIP
jgi:2-polyprenyl-6-methoxyphenol hydroxylase-like FAD-dependent oxidoreductase